MPRVLLTGGTGYIGSALTPALLAAGYEVHIFARKAAQPALNLSYTIGDIRDADAVSRAVAGCDAVIHLAGVPDSADPAGDRAINEGAFPALMHAAAAAGVKRFLFVSTSALYGSGGDTECSEDAAPEPLTGYARHKLACEQLLAAECPATMAYTILRPGAICGLAPAMRMDVLVHLMTRDAVTKQEITVRGAAHYRPHLPMTDMVRACIALLDAPHEKINREIFNLASENLTLGELAELVRDTVHDQTQITILQTEDTRSYRIDSGKIRARLGFSPASCVSDAVAELRDALVTGALADPFDLRYYPSKRAG